MHRLLKASLFLLAIIALVAEPRRSLTSTRPVADDERSLFALELPDVSGQIITAPEAEIPSYELSSIKLRILKPLADEVNYGGIHTKINGEAADTIFDYKSDLRGFVLQGDLKKTPRLRLRPGKNVVEITAVDRSRKSHYVSYVLLAGRAGATGASAGLTIEAVPIAAGEDRQPPEIRLSQPLSTVRLTNDTGNVLVAGVALDNAGAVESVKINGQAARLTPATGARGLNVKMDGTVTALSPDAIKSALAFEQTVAIGTNVESLVVEARDKAGNLTRLSLPVKRREAIVSSGFKGRKYALVVGVSRYKYHDGGLGDLAYADVDARSLRDFLQSREGGGFAPDDIVYLENERATVEAVRAAINSFLPKAGPQDLILIFIAGHGGPDPYAQQDLYFVLHDTKVADMPNTALKMDELQDVLEHRVHAGRLVVFVDTCHSAGLSGEKLVAARGVENNLINLYASRLFNEAGRAVITSSDVNEVSQEGARWGSGHGVFTWVLLEGLRGSADANADHYVTAGELFDYVRDRVRVETDFRQNPRALPGNNGQLTLAVAGGK